MLSFLGIALPVIGVFTTLVFTNNFVKGVTGDNLVEVIVDSIPNAIKFIQSCFEIFRTYFELLPPHIKSIFGIFLSVMSIIVLIKFKKGSD